MTKTATAPVEFKPGRGLCRADRYWARRMLNRFFLTDGLDFSVRQFGSRKHYCGEDIYEFLNGTMTRKTYEEIKKHSQDALYTGREVAMAPVLSSDYLDRMMAAHRDPAFCWQPGPF